MSKAFASQGELTAKKISFTEIGEGLDAFTAEGDPNSGVIIRGDSVMVVEAQATPRLAQKVAAARSSGPSGALRSSPALGWARNASKWA